MIHKTVDDFDKCVLLCAKKPPRRMANQLRKEVKRKFVCKGLEKRNPLRLMGILSECDSWPKCHYGGYKNFCLLDLYIQITMDQSLGGNVLKICFGVLSINPGSSCESCECECGVNIDVTNAQIIVRKS